jgi:multidrug efflux pump subunit AcrB
MKTLIQFFVQRPLLINMMVAVFIVSGMVGLRGQNYSSDADIDAGVLNIKTLYPGASPEDVELSITTPIEDEILKVDGLEKITSQSMESISHIRVTMNSNNSRYDNDRIETQVQKAIDRAMSYLPDRLEQAPIISRSETSNLPIMELSISGKVPEETLRRVVRRIENSLRDIKSITGSDREGYRKKEVRIILDPERIHQLGIRIEEITEAIQKRNVRDTGGSLDSYVSDKGVVTIGSFERPKDVENVIIRTVQPGNHLFLRDVADVVQGYEDRNVKISVDGETVIKLYLRKDSEADGVSTAKAVRNLVEELNKDLPKGVKISIHADIAEVIEGLLSVLVGNFTLGMILVIIVLLAFFPARFSFWIAAGIPTTVLMVFAVLPAVGININQISLSGIILMLGVIVDDAIITSESILSRVKQGLAPEDAAITGTLYVSTPVFASAATTMLAFAPLAFLGGIEGKFLWMLPIVVILVIVMSLIECKLILPGHISRSLNNSGKKTSDRVWFKKVEVAYQRGLLYLLSHRYVFLLTSLILIVVSLYWGGSKIEFVRYPEVEVDTIFVQLELPTGSSLENTSGQLQQLESRVSDILPGDEILNITLTAGHHDFDSKAVSKGNNAAWGLLRIKLLPNEQRESKSKDLIERLRDEFNNSTGFEAISVHAARTSPANKNSVELDILGSGYEEQNKVAKKLISFLRQHPGTTEAWTSNGRGKDVIELNLRHQHLADYGFKVSDITRAVRLVFDGQIVDHIQTIEERINYRVQILDTEKSKLDILRSIYVTNRDGLPVALSNLADFEVKPGESSIRHFLGERSVTVYAEIDREKTSVTKINQELDNFIQESKFKALYDGLHFYWGGEIEKQSDVVKDFLSALVICLTLILFVLVLLFNSFIQPFFVMSVIPIGIIGVIVSFAFHGVPLSVVAIIGIMGLVGILVNNTLIMIDQLNKSRLHSRASAISNEQIVLAASIKLRPVVITTATTMVGLFPAAYGLAGGNPLITPMILAMFWGVFVGGFTTLYLLPCFYAAEQDIRSAFQ